MREPRARALRLSLLLAAASVLWVCAPDEGGGDGVALQLYMSRAFADRMSALQISVVANSREVLARGDPTLTCLNAQVAVPGGLVKQGGKNTSTFSVGEKNVELKDIPAGSNYLIVAEALSRVDTGSGEPQLLGSGFVQVQNFKPGPNEVQTITLRGNPDGGYLSTCNPTIAP